MRTEQEIREKLAEIRSKTKELEDERPYLSSDEEYKSNMRNRWWLEHERRLLLWILEEYEFVGGF